MIPLLQPWKKIRSQQQDIKMYPKMKEKHEIYHNQKTIDGIGLKNLRMREETLYSATKTKEENILC